MTRVKRGVNHTQKRKKILKRTKGFRFGRNRIWKFAKYASVRAATNAYVSRKLKKRDFRSVWIQRINAGARLCGTTYSELISNLSKSDMDINRKMLSEIAATDMETFKQIVTKVTK